MSLVGNEIVQTVKWLDPNAPAPPSFNHVNTFPITVFDAVKQDMFSDGPTLSDVLASIKSDLNTKQTLIPGKAANYLVTYSGTPGVVGSVKMTQEIPLKFEDQRTDLIPTEKAVGEFLIRIGLLDAEGNVIGGGSGSGDTTIRWSQIIGRPNAYYNLGDNDDGYITQNAVTKAIKDLQESVNNTIEENLGTADVMRTQLANHIANYKNPHNVTAVQIGAVTTEAFKEHLDDFNNPHKVSKEQLGLDKVDNTSDMEKPISKAVQEALNEINDKLSNITTDDGTPINAITDILYDKHNNTMTLKFGSSASRDIELVGAGDSITNISLNQETKEIIVTSRNGTENRLDLSSFGTVGSDTIVGSTGSEINIEVDIDPDSKNNVISGTLVERAIIASKLANDAVESRTIKDGAVGESKIADNAVTTDKIRDNAITSGKIESNAVTSSKIADRAVEGRNIFSSEYDDRVLVTLKAGNDPVWSTISHAMLDKSSVAEDNIVNGSITTEKIADGAITSDKLAEGAISGGTISDGSINGDKFEENVELPGTPSASESPTDESDNNELATTKWVRKHVTNYIEEIINNVVVGDRSIDGSKLFTSDTPNRILGVINADEDAKWTTINHDMLEENIIDNSNIQDDAVTARTIRKLSIENRHLAPDVIETHNIKDEAITSEKIWSSPNANVVLGVLEENGHPVYTVITGKMIDENSIETRNIQDGSITASKMATSEDPHRLLGVTLGGTNPHWTQATNGMIGDRVIDGRTLFTSPQDNRILATAAADTDPLWMQVNSEMIGDGEVKSTNIGEAAIQSEHISEKAIEGKHIKDNVIQTSNISPRAVTGTELFTSPYPNRVLGVSDIPYSDPVWLQVTTDMIADGAVDLSKLAPSELENRILAVTEAGTTPDYIKITGDFIRERSILPVNLASDFAFTGTPSLTVEPNVDADNLQLATTHWVRNLIKDIDIDKVFKIEPHSIDGSLLMTSNEGPGVLGITTAGEDVDFITINEDLIDDGAVSSNKLQRDLTLFGSSKLEVRPLPSASDATEMGSLIPDCQWVLDRIAEAGLNGGGPVIPSTGNTIQNILAADVPGIMTGDGLEDIEDYEMTDDGSMVRGIRASDIEKIVAEIDDDEDIENNQATVENGIGVSYIPDDDINNIVEGNYVPGEDDNEVTGTGNGISGGVGGGSSSGGTGTALVAGSVGTYHIQNRAVTGEKLFTSSTPNMILAVRDSNSDPAWTKITSDMIDKHNVTGKNIFTSSDPSRVLVVRASNSDPVWGQIEKGMLADGAITADNLADGIVTTGKIANGSITAEKIANSPVVSTRNIFDESITAEKIADNAVTEDKLKDGTITSSKFANVVELPSDTTVKSSTNYERRALRNTILSPDAPSGGEDGDIWFRYI